MHSQTLIKKILFGCVCFFFGSCHSYENKARYEIKVGEQVELYYSTNSCCYYCLSNEGSLRHLRLIERKTLDPGPSDCDGCNYTAAFVLEGNSAGTDTVELKSPGATENCDSSNVPPEKYIVTVKEPEN